MTRLIRPNYVVRVEERVYVEHSPDERPAMIRPDVAILKPEDGFLSGGTATALADEPMLLTLPVPEQQEEVFLTIRERATMEVVTVIEVLSPGNKRLGADGRREYLAKREAVLASFTSLVELDLLLEGERLPTVQRLPPADYYAFVCRGYRRPRVEVYRWTLKKPLPSVPIPLKRPDPDVVVDLQAVFTTVYDRAGYDYSLDYRHPLELELTDGQRGCLAEVLQPAGSADKTPT
jgi:hypothetical protein